MFMLSFKGQLPAASFTSKCISFCVLDEKRGRRREIKRGKRDNL